MTDELVVASFNAHWGVGRTGATRARRFDVAAVVAGFDADLVVVPESWRSPAGAGILDPLAELGYRVESRPFMALADRRRRARHEGVVPADGIWELAICTRLPVRAVRTIPMGRVPGDPAGAREALSVTVVVGARELDVVGLHSSSRVHLGGSIAHLRRLRREIAAGASRADIVAGDFNLWGPPVAAVMRGRRRAVRGRTYPAHRPHSQIDHVLVRRAIDVVAGRVLDATPSDHRPIWARLRLGPDPGTG
ncbi:MAG: endonuclease/exonuclease/phosphatase family protein [Actinomycetota bacterium]